jgi:hypothetical protein
VDRDEPGRTTRYTVAIPLATIGVEPGREFALNLQVVDADADAGQLHALQLAEGMAVGAGDDFPDRYPLFVIEGR